MKLSQIPKLIAALCVLLAGAASAHVGGGGRELYHGVAGPYEVWVTDRSSTPVTGPRHLKVTVLSADTKAAVPGVAVRLTLTSPDGRSSTYDAAAGTRDAFFEVDAPLARAGRWRLTFVVEGARGRERVAFSQRLFTPLQLGLGLAGSVAAPLLPLALLGFGTFDLRRPGRRGRLASG